MTKFRDWLASLTSATPESSDSFYFVDSSESNASKRATLSSIKSALGFAAGDITGLGDLATQDTIAVPSDITATGTATASTFLRGDGAWAEPAGSGSAEQGVYRLEEFAGADDDAKLVAAIAQVQADTYKRPIALWEAREYEFNDTYELFNGFALIGPPNRHGDQPVTTARYPNVVTIGATSQPFLTVPDNANTYNIHISNLSFRAASSGVVFLGHDTTGSTNGVLWTSVIRDVGFSLFESVLGTTANKLLITACTFDGYWNVNNGRQCSISIGGSDNNLWPQGMLLDSPTSLTSGGAVDQHLWCDYLEKSNIGPLYITCEGQPAGIRIDGSSTSAALTFHGGMRVEGRNASSPALGAVVHMNGGQVMFRDVWFGYGFSNVAGLSGSLSGRGGELGVVWISGGKATFDGCTYARASSVADTVPYIYATGSGTAVRVVNQQVANDGGSFTTTGKAHVRAVSGASLYHDYSITDVDSAYTPPWA